MTNYDPDLRQAFQAEQAELNRAAAASRGIQDTACRPTGGAIGERDATRVRGRPSDHAANAACTAVE